MRRQLDIADVEERTKIRAKYLRALENEEWGALPGHTFVKTFLRTYAEVVGVDPHLLVEQYRMAHEAEEADLQPLVGPPPATGREARRERRRSRAAAAGRDRHRGPPRSPGRGIVVVGLLVVALVAFLLVLGLFAENGPDRERAGDDQPRADPERADRRSKRRNPAPARGATLRIAPTLPTYVCLDTGEGTDVLFEGTLEAPRTFRAPRRLRVNLGKRSVELRANGKVVPIEQSPDPIGLEVTKAGAEEIAEGLRPCA